MKLLSPPVAIKAISTAIAIFCVLSLTVGWLLGNDLFVRGNSNFPAMVPTTQLSFIGLIAALMLVLRGDQRALRTAAVLSNCVILLVGANVAIRLLFTDTGIDGFLPIAIAATDHMSYATAALLALAAVLIQQTATVWPRQPVLLLGGALTGLTTVGSIAMAHSLHVDSPYVLGVAQGLSIFSMVLLTALFMALLLILGHEAKAEMLDGEFE